MKILKILGIAVVGLVAVGAVVIGTRTNPLGPIAGRGLSGEVATEPVSDWSFTDEHDLIAVETRPDAPHSVTTICIAYEGALYVPASGASAKSWPYYAIADPRVRVKVGDLIYPVRATRMIDEALRPGLIAAAREKYDIAADDPGRTLDDVWLFKLESASRGVAAAGSETPAALPAGDLLLELVANVVGAEGRSEKDIELDAGRHPEQLLAFAGVHEGMRAADLGAGSGYTTELLARAAGPDGVVYGQNTPAVIEKYVSESWPARLAKDELANVVRVDSDFATLPGVDSLDLITMVYVYHDALYQSVDRAQTNAALLASLAPGGSLVVIDHRAAPGSGEEVGELLHRIDESLVRRELLEAGFHLAAEADFMANPADPRDAPFFKMEIPSDSFVHRYVRPR
jgi:predicted methyltransferase